MGQKEMEIVLKEKVIEKITKLQLKKETILEMVQDNIESLIKAEEKEEVMLMGAYTLLLYKDKNQIVVTHLFEKQTIL